MHKFLIPLLFTVTFGACNNMQTQKFKEDSISSIKVTEKDKIIFFGNSLTAGYHLSPKESFPMLLQNKIEKLGLNYQCINAGNSGETSSGGVERIDWILSNNKPSIFVLELGANDGLRGLNIEACKTNLQTILSKVKSKYPTAKIIVAGMKVPPNMGQGYADRFHEMFYELAEENKVPLIPFLLKNVSGHIELLLEDGIHPNAPGQVIVAENVWEVLKKLL